MSKIPEATIAGGSEQLPDGPGFTDNDSFG